VGQFSGHKSVCQLQSDLVVRRLAHVPGAADTTVWDGAYGTLSSATLASVNGSSTSDHASASVTF